MVNRKIIAFYSPYTSAGKSAAARMLSDRVYNFASPIKRMMSMFCDTYGRDVIINRDLGLTPRDFNIAIGQGLKQLDRDIWVRIMYKYIEPHSNALIVIDDLRFSNEYAMLKDKGAKIIRVTNPEREIVKTETEGLLEGFEFDYELINCKRSSDKYHAQINEMMSELWT